MPSSKTRVLWSSLILLIYSTIANKSHNFPVPQFPHLQNTSDTVSLTISQIAGRIKQPNSVKMLYKYN